MLTSFTITNARIVTAEGVLEDAWLTVEGGQICAIGQGTAMPAHRVIDACGRYLFPGFIDIHSDAIEKGIEPRPNAFFPVDIAVHELDKKIAACGITTMFHSLSFAEMEVGLRSNSGAADIIRQIAGMNSSLKVNTRIHARFEVTDLNAVPYLEELIDSNLIQLFSFMDHSPGQGQFRDILAYKSYYGPVYNKSDDEMNRIIDRKQETRGGPSQDAIRRLVRLCSEQLIPIASHDDDSREKVSWMREMGITMTEFPVNIEAVRAAREFGITICLGSPNVVRGQSQASNMSARDAISQGFGDILCSDYAPMTLLHAVLTLEKLDILPLHEAVNMVSRNPARSVGIDGHTGSIKVGMDADLLLVDHSDRFPRIMKTFIRGKEVFATC